MVNSQYEKLEEMRRRSQLGGGLAPIDKQHASNKLTARERVLALLDEGTFHELDAFKSSPNEQAADILGEGVVAGWGNINGRLTYVYAQDFTVVGGTL